MRDEIGDVRPLRQMPGMGCGGVEDDDDGAWRELRQQRRRHRANRSVRHGEDDDVRVLHRMVGLNAGHAEPLAHALPPSRTDFDVTNGEMRAPQVAAKPHAHLSAGSKHKQRTTDAREAFDDTGCWFRLKPVILGDALEALRSAHWLLSLLANETLNDGTYRIRLAAHPEVIRMHAIHRSLVIRPEQLLTIHKCKLT